MTSPNNHLADIANYISNLKLDSKQIDPSNSLHKRVYKKFHSVLIWNEIVEKSTLNQQTKLYQRETAADISTSYFLTYAGIYKSARLSFRSGLENLIRVTLSAVNVDVSEFDSVPKLISEAKLAAAKITVEQKKRIIKLYECYGELCQTVHSVSIDYMSLKVPFEKIIEHNQIDCKKNLEFFDKCLTIVTEVYFVLFHELLTDIDYKNADFIKDNLALKVKKEVLN